MYSSSRVIVPASSAGMCSVKNHSTAFALAWLLVLARLGSAAIALHCTVPQLPYSVVTATKRDWYSTGSHDNNGLPLAFALQPSRLVVVVAT